MLGGQRRVRHTVLDGGQDGVRLHHRQESPRPNVADATAAQAGVSDGERSKMECYHRKQEFEKNGWTGERGLRLPEENQERGLSSASKFMSFVDSGPS